KINIDGAGWNLIPASAFTLNDYNLNLNVNSNDNPLAGQPAFTGSDGGSPDGSWGTSVINLSELGVMAGSNIVIRWELGTDGCNGTFGWYVDDISVYNCLDCQDSLTMGSLRTNQQILMESGVHIFSSDTLEQQSEISYSAGTDLEFGSGFEVEQGSVMEAKIEGCTTAILRVNSGAQTIISLLNLVGHFPEKTETQNESPDLLILKMDGTRLDDPGKVTIQKEKILIDRLPAGNYTCMLKYEGKQRRFQIQAR
ncbi:MAG: hypothetical protein KDC80_01890, partial [Saprospiraceae bacterium]|nr:hypothetical protein [Saprospiraceae bacterium]